MNNLTLTIEDVFSFCEAHRAAGGGYRACSKCPVQNACTSDSARLTQETLDAWKSRCIRALESSLSELPTRQ